MISLLLESKPAMCSAAFESIASATSCMLLRLIPDVFVQEDADAHEVVHVAYRTLKLVPETCQW